MVQNDVTATALVSLDNGVMGAAPKISEGDIIEELRHRKEEDEKVQNNDDILIEEILDPVVEMASRLMIESTLDDLKDATIFSDKGLEMKRLILNFKRLSENKRLKFLKQRHITDFFTLV